MREWDRIEAAVFGRTPKDALRIGLAASLWCLTAKVDGRPEAMMGLTPVSLAEGKGQPWMLGTEAVYDHPRALAIGWRGILGRMREVCPRLENRVAAGNTKAIVFIRHLGFVIDPDQVEVGGVPMLRFAL